MRFAPIINPGRAAVARAGVIKNPGLLLLLGLTTSGGCSSLTLLKQRPYNQFQLKYIALKLNPWYPCRKIMHLGIPMTIELQKCRNLGATT
jgi:hypothetical protein